MNNTPEPVPWDDAEWAAKALIKHCAKTAAAPEASQRSEVSSGEWVGVLERRSYTYDDLLEAYKTGRYHEIQYGRGDGDQEDFITWLKRRCTPTGGDKPPPP